MNRTKLHAAAAALLVVLSLSGCTLAKQSVWSDAGQHIETPPAKVSGSASRTQSVQLVRVVDGDTIAVRPTAALPSTNKAGTEHVVRLLGIDAPEMNKMEAAPPQCGAQEAWDHLEQLLTGHRQLELVFDPTSDSTDRFGRSLAYVEIPGHPAVDVNLAQVKAGWAEAWYPKSEDSEPSREQSYLKAQRQAVQRHLGADGECKTVGR